MNWKRIWLGGLLAAGVMTICDLLWLAFVIRTTPAGIGPVAAYRDIFLYLPPNLVAGMILTGLYAMARPRLGPGPRTALIICTLAFALVHLYTIFHIKAWFSAPLYVLVQSVGLWIKFAAATYLAGWQYIEKSPE